MEKVMEKAAYSVNESCSYVGIGRAYFYRLMGGGKIPSFNIGRRRLIRKADLDKFLEERLEEAGFGPSE